MGNTTVALSLVVCVGCTVAEPPATLETVSEQLGCKPEAPVDMAIASRQIGDGLYRLELAGTPRGRVDSIDLTFVLPDHVSLAAGDRRQLFGETSAGVTRRVGADVRVQGAGAMVSGSARLNFAGISPSKVAEISLGSPPRVVERPTRAIATPSGEVIDEVRP